MSELEILEARLQALEADLARLVEAREAGRVALVVDLVDEQGRTRAMLATGHGGAVSLNLLDQQGRLRAALGIGAAGPTVLLLDEAGAKRVELGAAGLKLADFDGAPRIDARVDGGGPALGVRDPSGSPQAVLLVRDGQGVVGAAR